MSELGSSAAVGIESVEWLDAGGGQLTVRVTGRWRRRRGWMGSESRGPTTLVLEAEGRRHRFPATPEPPSIVGAAPGTWRLSFSIPAELAPELGHVWLALGTVTVPLPVPESAAGAPPQPEPQPQPAAEEAPPAQPQPEPEADQEPWTGPPSLEIERAWRRAEDAEQASAQLGGRIDALEQALGEALERERRGREQAQSLEEERERRRRLAEQRAHAEEAMRQDLTRRVVAGEQEAARARESLGELAAAEERIRELESRLDDARRANDEAERAAAAAGAERDRARRELAGARDRPAEEADRLRAEDALRSRYAAPAPRIPAEPLAARGEPGAPAEPTDAGTMPALPLLPLPVPVADDPAFPPAPAPVTDLELVDALRRELDARVAAEAGLRARTVQAETRLATRVLLEQRTSTVLSELRTELARLRAALEQEVDRRRAAEAEADGLREELDGEHERSRDALTAIGELRGELDELAPPAAPRPATPGASEPAASESGTPDAPSAGGGTVTPERLSDALARLRDTTEPRDPVAFSEPAAGGTGRVGGVGPGPLGTGPTVEPAFRRLAGRDAAQAGRLLLSLLGAQRSAYPHPIAYDLVLGPGHGCVQVTVGEDTASIERSGAARAREQVDFAVIGDPARLARLLVAGPLRRLLRIGIARVRGRRDGLAALRSVLWLALDLDALRAAGMHADAESLLALVAAMIDPAWTRGERFTITHTDERGRNVHLQIRDGAPPLVSRAAPQGRIATALAGDADGLVSTLIASPGRSGAGNVVSGDVGPLSLVRDWVSRAQTAEGHDPRDDSEFVRTDA